MKSQKQIGGNIKEARKKIKLTQFEVAQKVGIHVNYYARIERGEKIPSIDVMETLVKVLKIKSSDILPF